MAKADQSLTRSHTSFSVCPHFQKLRHSWWSIYRPNKSTFNAHFFIKQRNNSQFPFRINNWVLGILTKSWAVVISGGHLGIGKRWVRRGCRRRRRRRRRLLRRRRRRRRTASSASRRAGRRCATSVASGAGTSTGPTGRTRCPPRPIHFPELDRRRFYLVFILVFFF